MVECEFAVALIDIVMPGDATGLQLVEHALEVQPFLAVVMVTGVDDPSIVELELRVGAYGFPVKPFTDNEVLVAVANAGRRPVPGDRSRRVPPPARKSAPR